MSGSSQPLVTAVVICTKNRSASVVKACKAIVHDRPGQLVIVVDASDDNATERVCERLLATESVRLKYRRAARPGLARQRNEAASVCAELGVTVVHFIDDDIEILPGYLDAIESRFDESADVAGVGGVVENLVVEMYPLINRLFLLSGVTPHTIRKSGRVVIHQPSWGARRRGYPEHAEWLHGKCMSYRTDVIKEYRFDDRLTGYSHGEDRDFSFRVGREWRLVIEESARCRDHGDSANPYADARRYSYDRTVLEYAWVCEHRRHGFSRVLFLWSAVGEVVMYLGAAALPIKLRRDDRLGYALGVWSALVDILRGRDEPFENNNAVL